MLVLRTIDWEAVTIGVLIAECSGMGCRAQADADVAAFLAARGLSRAATLRARHDIWDAVYVNRSLIK